MRRFLATIVVLQLLIATGALAAPTVDEWLQDRIDPALEGTVDVGPPATRDVIVPRPGQTLVRGTVTSLVADLVAAPTIPTPFSIEAGTRGVTRAVIAGALVGGRRATISWDGGRPLPITGGPGLELGATRLTVGASGLVWALEGEPRPFVPGTYRANFTVGVATEGIASVREGVTFTADGGTALQVTKDAAFVRQNPAELTITAAQAATATLQGGLELQTEDGTREVAEVQFGPGLYQITLTPEPGGFRVDGVLQGPVES